MNGRLRTRAMAFVLAVVVTVGIAALSRVPYGQDSHEHAIIRLSWRTPGEFVHECRTPTAEELERLPVHMRRDEICEGRILPKRLVVTVNGSEAIDEVVRATGVREDRPLYVHREIHVPPGEHTVAIRWATEQGSEAAPLELAQRVPLEAGQIALFTYDVDRRTLVVRGGTEPPSNDLQGN